ncbi:MAG: hypothetical protein ACI9MC_002200, partial [Kiritimatiellia bacterium]
TQTGDRCLSCHEGIEPIHGDALPYGECTSCHGGDAESKTLEGAHVAIPADWASIRGDGATPAPNGYIRDFSPSQLDKLDPAYLRFINPSDIRVNEATCGACHPVKVATQRNSIMTTNAGHYMPTRFLVGLQDRDALVGTHAATDPNYDGKPGTVPSLDLLVPPLTSEGDVEQTAYDHYLSKSCNHCHAASFGKNEHPAAYRSSGCASCHMVYEQNGTYTGGDKAIPKNRPVHPSKHRITTEIPVEQCATCHFQGGRIGLLYRGIREGGFKDTPPNAVPWNESVYGHTPGYYILDEDSTNSFDETPPDVHYQAGMACVDCHIGTDVHGDGSIYSTSKFQVDLACEDCHGTVRESAQPNENGRFLTRGRGRHLKQLHQDGDNIVLTTKIGKKELVVPQPAKLLSQGGDGGPGMHAAMGVKDGWSHTDDVACATCHSGYQQFCIGCHVNVDYRFSQRDWQSGLVTPGQVRGSRESYALDKLLLSKGVDGRAWPTNPSQQVQMTVIDDDGNTLMDDAFRQTEHSEANIGFAPFFQHTTARIGRSCKTCHRTDDSPQEWARVRGVYGFGTGEFMLPDANGNVVDALQYLDADGKQLTEWVHEGTGPLDKASRDRALSVVLP